MSMIQEQMLELEARDYSKLEVPDHLLHLVIMRDRLAYYSLQLAPFFEEKTGDLPIVIDGRIYGPARLTTLQGTGMTTVEFFSLLSDIEVALIEAAGRRGIKLNGRKIDSDATSGTPSKRPTRPRGSALGR